MDCVSNLFPEWAKSLTIYEVNLRQYTSSGTIKEFKTHLPRLKELGVGILWFMPIQPIGVLNRKGTLGSYYSISNYHEVHTEYGSLVDFIELVEEIHNMGMYVILDWVTNHTAWDHQWINEHPDFYKKNDEDAMFSPFDWTDVAQLNYDNISLRVQMVEEMKFWLSTTGIDGFRCDMAHLVPLDFWQVAREELEKIKPILLLGETENLELTSVFNVIYNWKLFHAFNDVAQCRKQVTELRHMIEQEIIKFPSTAENLLFISNHDENSWNGSELERLGLALEAFAVLIFTLPGMPLLYSGQEAGNPKRLSFFEKDAIEWKEDKMFPLYRKLIALRQHNSALHSIESRENFVILQTDKNDNVWAFARKESGKTIIVAVNLSPDMVDAEIKTDDLSGIYHDFFLDIPVFIGRQHILKLNGWGYCIFTA